MSTAAKQWSSSESRLSSFFHWPLHLGPSHRWLESSRQQAARHLVSRHAFLFPQVIVLPIFKSFLYFPLIVLSLQVFIGFDQWLISTCLIVYHRLATEAIVCQLDLPQLASTCRLYLWVHLLDKTPLLSYALLKSHLLLFRAQALVYAHSMLPESLPRGFRLVFQG